MTNDPAQALPVLHSLSSAVAIRAIYPSNHPRVEEAVDRLVETLQTCLRERGADEVTFLIIDSELLVDQRPTRAHMTNLAALVRTLSANGIERVSLAAGADAEECQRLVGGLTGTGELDSSPHVLLGRIQIEDGDGDSAQEALPRLGSTGLSEDDLDRAEDSFLRFRSDSKGSIEQLDRVLWRFVEGMDKSSRSLLLLSPMKGADQRLFVHSINVSLLTLAQARGLGIEGQALHDIGLAALLHDIGKLSLPMETLHAGQRYTDREWELVKQHPELGAAQLCGLPGAPPLTVVVAYEHHLRWDGLPSFPTPAMPRLPSVASQLTAVADTYDVMIAGRGLAGGVGGKAALEVWEERAGTYLDPFLVGNFLMTLSDVERVGVA
ncbi:MAG: HD domain-containing protein [bacterium]|nr:HD domain-containing protein [bacterium]